jgi:hypothetical protein
LRHLPHGNRVRPRFAVSELAIQFGNRSGWQEEFASITVAGGLENPQTHMPVRLLRRR